MKPLIGLHGSNYFKMFEKEFVTLEIAKLLKEVNFDMPCFAYFTENGDEHFLPANATEADFGSLNQNITSGFISRPLWQQMYRWFDEKHQFVSSIFQSREKWHWRLVDRKVFRSDQMFENSGDVDTEEEAILGFVNRAVLKIKNPNLVEEDVHDRSLRLLKEYLDSPESDKYFEDLKLEQEAQNNRFIKFDEYLQNHSFDVLMARLILENGDEWRDKCYKKGCEPYPTNLMQFVLDYVKERGVEQELGTVDENMFESELYLFHGYYFQLSQGQGCFWRIFDLEKNDLLTI